MNIFKKYKIKKSSKFHVGDIVYTFELAAKFYITKVKIKRIKVDKDGSLIYYFYRRKESWMKGDYWGEDWYTAPNFFSSPEEVLDYLYTHLTSCKTGIDYEKYLISRDVKDNIIINEVPKED